MADIATLSTFVKVSFIEYRFLYYLRRRASRRCYGRPEARIFGLGRGEGTTRAAPCCVIAESALPRV